VIAKRKGVSAKEGLKEEWSNARVDEQEPDRRHTAPSERAYDREAHIHQGRWL